MLNYTAHRRLHLFIYEFELLPNDVLYTMNIIPYYGQQYGAVTKIDRMVCDGRPEEEVRTVGGHPAVICHLWSTTAGLSPSRAGKVWQLHETEVRLKNWDPSPHRCRDNIVALCMTSCDLISILTEYHPG